VALFLSPEDNAYSFVTTKGCGGSPILDIHAEITGKVMGIQRGLPKFQDLGVRMASSEIN